MKLISTNLRNLRRERRIGFTLVELLIAILIMGILLGIAIPFYISTEANSQEQACQSNMAAIFQAEESFRARSQTRTYTANMADLTAYMTTLPVCPDGAGNYVLAVAGAGSAMTLTITCPNQGAHVAGKAMVTSDGATFSFY